MTMETVMTCVLTPLVAMSALVEWDLHLMKMTPLLAMVIILWFVKNSLSVLCPNKVFFYI